MVGVPHNHRKSGGKVTDQEMSFTGNFLLCMFIKLAAKRAADIMTVLQEETPIPSRHCESIFSFRKKLMWQSPDEYADLCYDRGIAGR
jgi:hypothetical protein